MNQAELKLKKINLLARLETLGVTEDLTVRVSGLPFEISEATKHKVRSLIMTELRDDITFIGNRIH